MITQKDIAREAGVSVMTVSRVVNKQFEKVSQENIKTIQQIINKYSYVPNLSARGLSSKASGIIVLIIRGEGNRLMDPYNGTIVGYMSQYLQEAGFSTMIYTVLDFRDVTRRLRTWNAQGAIFFGMFDQEMELIREENKIPLVFNDSYSALRQVTNIGIDDYKGGQLAARHLLEMGHRSLGFCGSDVNSNGVDRQRFLGFSSALEEAGITLTEDRIFHPDLERMPPPAHFKSGKAPSALFVTSDLKAIELTLRLREQGLRVPEDCSIIGFDDLPLSRFMSPALTTIRQDIEAKARYTVDTLKNHISHPGHPSERMVLDVDLIIRGSVADLRKR